MNHGIIKLNFIFNRIIYVSSVLILLFFISSGAYPSGGYQQTDYYSGYGEQGGYPTSGYN